nr:immunoglobulin heavy chain junction region [Macaca mulatta]MOX14735.1 immunoglobulin heavy chain junction region [Macaca mulatta]
CTVLVIIPNNYGLDSW